MLSKLQKLRKSANSQVLMGNLGASFFGMITFMLLARVLPLHTFGEWAIFVAAAGFADLLRTGLIRQAMVRFISLTNDQDRKLSYQRASVRLHLVTVMIISIIMWLSWWLIGGFIAKPYALVLGLYPFWMIVSLPHMMDTWFSHALQDYKRMNRIRMIINVVFLAVVVSGFYFTYELWMLITLHMTIQLIVSMRSFIKHRSAFSGIWSISNVYIRQIFDFGKHSLATLTGANLLKSADHLIIGALMGTEAVAIYAIPLKVMDLLEIPLRGFVMTSFSKMSVMVLRKDIKGFTDHFYQWSGMLTILFIPLAMVLLIWPQLAVQILGGGQYGDSAILLQVFVVAMLIMPLDKYLGASFDSINAPKRNAIKVWIMVIVNILGDLMAIWLFDSLLAVSIATVLTLISGLIAGFRMHPILKFSMTKLVGQGIYLGKNQIGQFYPPFVDRSAPTAE